MRGTTGGTVSYTKYDATHPDQDGHVTFVNIADKLKAAAATWYAEKDSYAALSARGEKRLDSTDISMFALSFLGPEMTAAEKKELPPWGDKPAPVRGPKSRLTDNVLP